MISFQVDLLLCLLACRRHFWPTVVHEGVLGALQHHNPCVLPYHGVLLVHTEVM